MNKYGLEDRKRFSPRERLAIWEAHKGICVTCKLKIDGVRERWIIEHIIALELGGDNSPGNLGPSHEHCAIEKTKGDHSRGAKLKRVRQKHLGINPASRNPLPGGKNSGMKKTFGRGWVPRHVKESEENDE